jgi:hypothetical protein
VRCTRCSQPVRPVVVFDIDGTLGDYHRHFLRFLGGYLGADLMPVVRHYDGVGNFGDWVTDAFGISRDEYRLAKLAYRQGAQKRTMPAYDRAGLLTWAAREQGAEIWIATSRPYLRLDNIDPERVVMTLDDLGEMYDQSAEIFGANVPILRRNAWNGGVRRPQVVDGLLDARALLVKRAQEWIVRHEFDGLPIK